MRTLEAVIEYFAGEEKVTGGFETLHSAVLLLWSMKMYYRLDGNSFLQFIDDAHLQRLRIQSVDSFWRLEAWQMCKVSDILEFDVF